MCSGSASREGCSLSIPNLTSPRNLILAAASVAQVVAEFALIANTSALTFMVAGTFKEIVTGGCCCFDA